VVEAVGHAQPLVEIALRGGDARADVAMQRAEILEQGDRGSRRGIAGGVAFARGQQRQQQHHEWSRGESGYAAHGGLLRVAWA
jgi:hypothetical protein